MEECGCAPWRCGVFGFGAETFWLNVVNVAFGIVTVAAIAAVLGSIAMEIWRRARHHAGHPAHH